VLCQWHRCSFENQLNCCELRKVDEDDDDNGGGSGGVGIYICIKCFAADYW
jgi:hypothetical protein